MWSRTWRVVLRRLLRKEEEDGVWTTTAAI